MASTGPRPPPSATAQTAPPAPPIQPLNPHPAGSPQASSSPSQFTSVPLGSSEGNKSGSSIYVRKPQAPQLQSGQFQPSSTQVGAPPRKNAGHKSLLDGLQIAPWAHYYSNGLVALTLLHCFIGFTQYHIAVGPSVYGIIASGLIWFIEFSSQRCKSLTDDEQIYRTAGWPKILTAPLNLFQNYFARAILYILLSIYLFFASTTLICGFAMIVNACLYIAAGFHKEKGKPITGAKY